MSAWMTMAVMVASARTPLHGADGALPSGVNRALAGERGVRYEMKSSALMRRTMFLVLALLVPAVTVYADDWGMGQANARLPHPSMFRPISTPAQDISTLNCHVVRGVGANGRFGPDLTHLMSQETRAAGAALNTTANLKAWV